MIKKTKRSPAPRAIGSGPGGAEGGMSPRGLEDLLGHHLQQAHRAHLRRLASLGAAHDVRASQFSILNFLYCNPSVKQTELANSLGKKHANVVTALDELQRRGFISRVADPNDKRSKFLRLTPSGEQVTVELIERHAELNREIRGKLGAERFDRLLELLQAFSRIGD